MRALQLAVFFVLLQFSFGLVSLSGLFPTISYDSSITNVQLPSNVSATSDAEQNQATVQSFNTLINALTWGWVKGLFMPWYSYDAGLKAFVDFLITILNFISGALIAAAVIEMVRNNVSVFG